MAFNIGDDEFEMIRKRFPDNIYGHNINVFEYIEFLQNKAIIHFFNGDTTELNLKESEELKADINIKFRKRGTSFQIEDITFFHIIEENENKTYISNFSIKNIMGFSEQRVKIIMKSGKSIEFCNLYSIAFKNLINNFQKFTQGPKIRYLDEYSW